MIDEFSRRPEWVKWLPAALLTVVIVATAIFAIVAVPRLTAEPGPGQTDQVTDLNWSVFTEEGLRYIEAARTPRIDLSSPPVDAVTLGLPTDGALTVGPHVTDLDYRLVLIATDDEPNGALFTTPQFTVSTSGGRLQSVRVEERGAFDFRESYLLVAERSADYGFTAPTSRSLAEAVTKAREGGQPVAVRSNRGTSTGMGVTAEVLCFGAGACTVSYIVTPAVG
ncbi:MAG: hypothetical protein K2X36_05010 [Microbacteriaceae bacterium]|nr:hypothetical protein [Microbacteriaceae bacterium]